MKAELKATEVLRLLNGFICVYKPRDVSISALKKLLTKAICEEGNDLEEIIVPEIEMPIVEPHLQTQAPLVVGTRRQLDYTQHPLMAGRLFHPNDIQIEEFIYAEQSTSGVCLFGIGSGCDDFEKLKKQALVNEYIIDAELGKEKYENMIYGKIIHEAIYDHVTQLRFQKLLNRLQAQFKRAAFELTNVDPQSQEAFEIARQGVPRPKILDNPVVYNMELLKFMPPFFTLKINITSENDKFLRSFIRELALALGTVSCPRRIRRSRLGFFGVEHALLEKQFRLPIILHNIIMCNQIIEKNSSYEPVVKTRNQKDVDLETFTLLERYELDKIEEPKEDVDCLRIPWGREYSTVKKSNNKSSKLSVYNK